MLLQKCFNGSEFIIWVLCSFQITSALCLFSQATPFADKIRFYSFLSLKGTTIAYDSF